MYSYILMKLFGKSYLKYDGVCLICLIVMAVLCVSPVKVLEAQSFKNESVLNRGSWYKLGVTKMVFIVSLMKTCWIWEFNLIH